MKTDNETFYEIKSRNNKDWTMHKTLMFVFTVNFFIFVCASFDWFWWNDRNILNIILIFIYLFIILAQHNGIEQKGQSSLFVSLDNRLKCWRDYYESPDFVYHYPPPPPRPKNVIVIWTNQIDYAPIYDGDYVLLSKGDSDEDYLNDKYVKVKKSAFSTGKDIDFNDIYHTKLEFTDLLGENILYSSESHDYDFSSVRKDINEKIKSDGFSIIYIYNKYGDVRWKQSYKKTSPSKTRKILYGLISVAVRLIYIVIVLMPIIVPIILSISNSEINTSDTESETYIEDDWNYETDLEDDWDYETDLEDDWDYDL